jgi:hypothetical protein
MLRAIGFPLFVALVACACTSKPPGVNHCGPPAGGERCPCPGTSIVLFGCPEVFTCRQDGTWAPYDASCLTVSSDAGD